MTTPAPQPPSPVSTYGATLLPGVLRTVVPIVYALLIQWGVTEWFDPDNLTNLIVVVITGLFYVGLRVAERYWSKIGWLLGYAKQPVYVAPHEVVSIETPPTPPAAAPPPAGAIENDPQDPTSG